jgi:hypothetical protein
MGHSKKRHGFIRCLTVGIDRRKISISSINLFYGLHLEKNAAMKINASLGMVYIKACRNFQPLLHSKREVDESTNRENGSTSYLSITRGSSFVLLPYCGQTTLTVSFR